jgi:hypothetical protein
MLVVLSMKLNTILNRISVAMMYFDFESQQVIHLAQKGLHRTVSTIPATSTLSRQVFATVNLILNAKRIILPRENGEKIQMIHDNYSLLQGLTALWVPPEPQHLSHWSRECLKIFSQSRCFLLEIWLIEKRSIL